MTQVNPLTAQTMSSLEIAAFAGIRHDNVLRDIRVMLGELYPDTNHLKFEGVYLDAKGENRLMYNLPKRECLILVAKYSLPIRAAIIDRWLELEDTENLSTSEVLEELQQQFQDKLNQDYQDKVNNLVAEMNDTGDFMADSQAQGLIAEDVISSLKQELSDLREAVASLPDKRKTWVFTLDVRPVDSILKLYNHASFCNIEQLVGIALQWKFYLRYEDDAKLDMLLKDASVLLQTFAPVASFVLQKIVKLIPDMPGDPLTLKLVRSEAPLLTFVFKEYAI